MLLYLGLLATSFDNSSDCRLILSLVFLSSISDIELFRDLVNFISLYCSGSLALIVFCIELLFEWAEELLYSSEELAALLFSNSCNFLLYPDNFFSNTDFFLFKSFILAA